MCAGGTEGEGEDTKALSARQIMRYHQGVGERRTVLCRDSEGDEGQGEPLG